MMQHFLKIQWEALICSRSLAADTGRDSEASSLAIIGGRTFCRNSPITLPAFRYRR